MVRFTKWLKEHVGKEKITEVTLSEKLLEFRSMGDFSQKRVLKLQLDIKNMQL